MDDKRIAKVTVEYTDESIEVFDQDQMFLVIVDDVLEMFRVESTSNVGIEEITTFAENALTETKERNIMSKVKPSPNHKKARSNHLKVVR